MREIHWLLLISEIESVMISISLFRSKFDFYKCNDMNKGHNVSIILLVSRKLISTGIYASAIYVNLSLSRISEILTN